MHEENGNGVSISPYANVTVTVMSHIVEVQHLEKENHQANIRKLDKDRYLHLETGEIKNFEHTENRQQSYDSLRKTFKKLRYLINNNFTGKGNELHVTLTYAENMTDPKRLYKDFDKFIKRMRYAYKDKSPIDYICVVEPQERGAWHCHVLLRFNDMDRVYVENSELRRLWGFGFVTVKSLKNVDNIGAYLSAYLADVELTEDNLKEVYKAGDQIKVKASGGKKFIKGGRLHLYPPGMNIYRKSRGIVEPERQKMQFADVKKIVGSAKPHYQKKVVFERDDFENTVQYLQYNTKRNTD